MKRALEGIHILDLSWVLAGPLATKLLANFGATVVKVEHSSNVDLSRRFPPFADGVHGDNRSGTFTKYNDSKYAMTLNLKHPKAKGVVKKLVQWADVVLENFTAGTMERWRLAYPDLKKMKPDIIMIRASLMGQTGPYSTHPGFGTMLQAYSGFTSAMRWPDRMPAGSSVPYTDYPGAGFTAIAILAALDYKRRRKEGVYIDLSQLESAQQLLIPTLLDYAANRRVPAPNKNRHPTGCPHGVYPCRGKDRWCVITVFSEPQWENLKAVMGHPSWAQEARFSTLADRKENEDHLDQLMTEWTSEHEPAELMRRLQEAGVPAGMVSNAQDLEADPQLEHRRHFTRLEHPEMGTVSHHAPPFRLSLTPHSIDMTAPCMGQHTQFVCRNLLGLSQKSYERLVSEGVFT